MMRFLAKRLLIALPVLFVVAAIAFFMASAAPGDRVAELVSVEKNLASGTVSYPVWINEYGRIANRLGETKPLFYLSMIPIGWPDTLHRIVYKAERECAVDMLHRGRDWKLAQDYQESLRRIVHVPLPEIARGNAAVNVVGDARFLLITTDQDRVRFLWKSILDNRASVNSELMTAIDLSYEKFNNLEDRHDLSLSGFFPKIIWHGVDNQFHNWLSGIIKGDFGVSVIDGRPVGDKIKEAVGWTLRINLTAILLAFLIAIPLGLATARRVGSLFDRFVSSSLFIFFAIPSFWLATLLIVFFTTPEYASWMDLFSTGGLGRYHFASGIQRFTIMVGSLFLPVLSLLLGALAYITRQMRGSVLAESRKDYVRMAYAKGLTEPQVYRDHILRNALFPILTLVGAAIPASISGSVIIEVIFGIPGMGRLLYNSVLGQDWMVVFGMVVLASFLTVIGYLLSDVMYKLADPRLRQKRTLA